MKNSQPFLFALSAGAVLAGCGGDSSGDASSQASTSFTLGVSDAAVDTANKVVLAFEDVVLVPFNPDTGEQSGDPIAINVSNSGDLRKIDLMQYQGSQSETIINEQVVPPGDYALCVYAKDGKFLNDDSLSYVEKSDGSLKGLVVPSKGSCFGYKPNTSDQGRLKFSQSDEFVRIDSGSNSYIVEFDLRKGLSDPQGLDYMLMNSNAVTLVNASVSGHIKGDVNLAQYQACETDSASLNAINNVSAVHAVYLYSGVLSKANMGDLGTTDPALTEPLAVASVTEGTDSQGETVYSYEFGFIDPGTYSLGYTCTAFVDDASSHETAADGFQIYEDYSL